MSNVIQMIDRITSDLQGNSKDLDEQTWLTADISPSDLVLAVNDPHSVSHGIVEIGEEILWASRVDNAAATVTVAPYGRGYRSTTPSSHAANVAVINSPKYPRSQVRKAINDSIEGVYPDLYARATVEFPAIAARSTYELPADVDQVHRLSWETIGPTGAWAPITRWRFDPAASTTQFATGKAIDIWQAPVPGRTIQVTYIKPPGAFTDNVTDFATATGLPSSAEDCIIYGACFRLVGFGESPRLQISSIESQTRATLVPPGATQNAAKHFLQLYQLALQSERERLLRADPTNAHFRYI